ncbi:hypothetical protein ACHAWO_004922 [Cyclotella atomus]|uniref:Fe2OG dioxygenase domain-containing protein n=1 Tax=Cyclotella atomus TaxID=382360 RepID=A0ABD3PXN5_9STRA
MAKSSSRSIGYLITTIILSLLLSLTTADPTCSATESDFANDPALHTMSFDIGYGPQEMLTYVQPDVSTFYHLPEGQRTAATPRHNGWAAKFVNMSNKPVRLFWDPQNGRPGSIIGNVQPYNAAGTASFPGHAFYVTPAHDENIRLASWQVSPPQSVYYYDPITIPGDEEATQRNLDQLSTEEFEEYQRHVDNREFSKQYFEFTGREYLAFYPRNPPSHKMWRADYYGQQHWVTTRETHFVTLPDEKELGPIQEVGSARVLKENDARILQEYRSPEPVLNMTMTVLSCAPRAFEIKEFLSQAEVDHIMYLTTGMKLHRSTTAGANGQLTKEDLERDDTRNTRTSLNTWVYREKDAIIDTIYRRAADLLRIDEALLRPRGPEEQVQLKSKRSLAEALQLVHYDVGQEYTAHHDFGYSNIEHPDQPARFATLLLYLNEGMVGGATQFPRWVNAHTDQGLNVEPEVGKAVLFYSQLPDGNYDDWSHHAAMPVRQGEKWLMNLWVWDPTYDH